MKRKRHFIVGLTGGIGAGKSLALNIFRRLGAQTISLDAVAHELSCPGGIIYRRFKETLGPGILDTHGYIDRGALGARVFRDKMLRRTIERLSHPMILAEMRCRIAAVRRGPVIVDVPLLFEENLESQFDATVLIAAPLLQRIARVQRRDGLSLADVRRRITAQLPQTVKRRRADCIIDNEGTPAALRHAIAGYHRAFVLIQGG